MTLRFRDKLKPRQIAEKLKLPIKRVYRVQQRFMTNIQRAISKNQDVDVEVPHPVFKLKRLKKDDPERIHAIGQYLKDYGIREASHRKIRKYLNTVLPHKVPHDKTAIGCILKERYHLKYSTYNAAMIRYEDPVFNEKRLQVSRLLAQFLLDGAFIVSIDESSIRADAVMNKRWTFKSQPILKKLIEEHVEEDSDQSEAYKPWNEITSDISDMSHNKPAIKKPVIANR